MAFGSSLSSATATIVAVAIPLAIHFGWIGNWALWSSIVPACVAVFDVWHREYRRAEGLLFALAPKLEIVFESGIEPYTFDRSDGYRLVRLGIRNIGGSTVTNLRLELTQVQEAVGIHAPLPLQAMHHDGGTDLQSEREKHFDFVHQWPGVRLGVCHTVKHHSVVLPDGVYTMRVTAFGDCTPSVSRVFVVKTRGEGGMLQVSAVGF